MTKNKYEFFTPLMHKEEYKFIEKYLNNDDILLEWGAGSSTIYFSGIVKQIISIEHDIDYYQQFKKNIDAFNIQNVSLNYVKGVEVSDNKKFRHIAFKDYIEFPKTNNLKFTKVLIDGRARKHCAKFVYDLIDENMIVFIHDFNFNNVEGYIDEEYFDDILSKYDIIDRVTTGQGIVALKKKIKLNVN